MRQRLEGFARGCVPAALVVLLALAVSTGAGLAQKNKKPDNSPNSAAPMPAISGSASDQIDHAIGEMMGAFQVGDVEAMHKYYADNATFVSGSFEPPVVGWQNYVNRYQSQRAAFPGMQLIRRNTFIFVHQDVSWVSYQWEFASKFNGKPFNARGQTTLVLNKVGENWVIVHNHTSEICPQAASQPQAPVQKLSQSAPGKSQGPE